MRYDDTIQQGATFRRVLAFKQPDLTYVDLTGYTARGQVRSCYGATSVVASYTCTVAENLTAGRWEVTVELTDVATAMLMPGRAVYDLELVSGGGEVTRVLEGFVEVTPEVTR
jgi:hypothetical protein